MPILKILFYNIDILFSEDKIGKPYKSPCNSCNLISLAPRVQNVPEGMLETLLLHSP